MANVTAAEISLRLDNGTPVVAGTENSGDPYNLDPAQGVIGNHAYTVVGITSSGGSAEVTLRNPWGQNSTAEYADSIGGANDGIITISWATFTEYFEGITWRPISGPSINSPQAPGPIFSNSSPGEVYAYVGQPVTLDLSAVSPQGGIVYYSMIGEQVGSLGFNGTYTWIPGPNDLGDHVLEVLARTAPTSASSEFFNVYVNPTEPTVGGLTVNPTSIDASGTDKLTLQATNVSAPEGTLLKVAFSLDVAGPAGTGQTDTYLGSGTAASNWTWSGFVGGLAPGSYTVSAVATTSDDFYFSESAPVTAGLTVTPAPDYEPTINRTGSEVRVAENAAPLIGLGTITDDSGNVRVFWTEVPAPSTQYMSEYNSGGTLVKGPVQLATQVAIVQLEQATFVGLPDGSFDEVYSSTGALKVQKYSGSGIAEGGPITAAIGVQLDQTSWLQAAADGSGNLLLAVSDAVDNVYAVSVSASGQVTRSVWLVSLESSNKLRLDSVALDDDGAGVIVWTDFDQEAIIAHRVTAAGLSIAAGQFTVFQDPTVDEASAGVDDSGNVTIVYDTQYGVNYRRYGGDGTSDSGDQLVYTSVNDGPENPRVAVTSGGWAFVAWDDPKYYGYGGALTVGKLINPEGQVQGSLVPAPTDGIADIMGGIAMNDQGRIFVAYSNLYNQNIGGYAVNISSFWADMEPAFGGPYQFTVPLESAAGTVVGTVAAIDPDGEHVTYSLLGSGAFAIDSTTGVITVADPTVLQTAAVTSYTLTVQANDGYGDANVRPVTNVAIMVNDPTPPVITPMPNWTIDADESVSPVIQASDPDGSAVTFSAAVGDGASATASISGNDVIVTPFVGYTGTFPVTVTATNGLDSATTTFQVTVVSPILAPVNDITTHVPVSLKLNGSDASGAALTYSAATAGGGPPPATFSINNNVVTIAPTPGYAGTFTVTVAVSDGPDTASQSFRVTVPQTPVPTITSLSPAMATEGSGPITLTVTGTNFASGYSVLWNNTALGTIFVSATSLTATIPASDLTQGGAFAIAIGYFGETAPGSKTFTIAAQPEISGLNPASAVVGSGQITITVNGENFVNGSTVLWNGTLLGTVFLDSTTLTATVPATDLVQSSTDAITVRNPKDMTSNVVSFNVVGLPAILSLSAVSATQGAAQFKLEITGTDFVNGSTVFWNGTALGTSFGDAGTLEATVPASLLASAGVASVVVANPGNAVSEATLFTIIGTGPPLVTTIAAGSQSPGGLMSIIVSFSEPMNAQSVQRTGAFNVLGAVKKRGRTLYTKRLGFSVTYQPQTMSATITFSAAYKGEVKVTAKRRTRERQRSGDRQAVSANGNLVTENSSSCSIGLSLCPCSGADHSAGGQCAIEVSVRHHHVRK